MGAFGKIFYKYSIKALPVSSHSFPIQKRMRGCIIEFRFVLARLTLFKNFISHGCHCYGHGVLSLIQPVTEALKKLRLVVCCINERVPVSTSLTSSIFPCACSVTFPCFPGLAYGNLSTILMVTKSRQILAGREELTGWN